MSNIHHKWSLLNIISNGFNSLIIFHAEFFKILRHVNITVTFETDIVSAEHYHNAVMFQQFSCNYEGSEHLKIQVYERRNITTSRLFGRS